MSFNSEVDPSVELFHDIVNLPFPVSVSVSDLYTLLKNYYDENYLNSKFDEMFKNGHFQSCEQETWFENKISMFTEIITHFGLPTKVGTPKLILRVSALNSNGNMNIDMSHNNNHHENQSSNGNTSIHIAHLNGDYVAGNNDHSRNDSSSSLNNSRSFTQTNTDSRRVDVSSEFLKKPYYWQKAKKNGELDGKLHLLEKCRSETALTKVKSDGNVSSDMVCTFCVDKKLKLN